MATMLNANEPQAAPKPKKKTMHDELVEIAAKWLRRDHPLVITEIASGSGEQPDAIGFKPHVSCLIECKTSRADFLRDFKKGYRQPDGDFLGDYRYYMCPVNVIKKEEVPDLWGLLYVWADGKVGRVVEAQHYSYKRDHDREVALLVSLIRRIAQHPIDGVSIKCYTYETKCRATAYIKKEDGDGRETEEMG